MSRLSHIPYVHVDLDLDPTSTSLPWPTLPETSLIENDYVNHEYQEASSGDKLRQD